MHRFQVVVVALLSIVCVELGWIVVKLPTPAVQAQVPAPNPVGPTGSPRLTPPPTPTPVYLVDPKGLPATIPVYYVDGKGQRTNAPVYLTLGPTGDPVPTGTIGKFHLGARQGLLRSIIVASCSFPHEETYPASFVSDACK